MSKSYVIYCPDRDKFWGERGTTDGIEANYITKEQGLSSDKNYKFHLYDTYEHAHNQLSQYQEVWVFNSEPLSVHNDPREKEAWMRDKTLEISHEPPKTSPIVSYDKPTGTMAGTW